MLDFYEYALEMKRLYSLLKDEKSQKLFWARMKCDMDKNYNNFMLFSDEAGYCVDNPAIPRKEAWDKIDIAVSEGKKIALYGIGYVGMELLEVFKKANKRIDVFVDRAKFGKIVEGIPVISPHDLISSKNDYYVIISTTEGYRDIVALLHNNSFPENQILFPFGMFPDDDDETHPHQYFEFLQYYKGGAYIDVGAYDGSTVIDFYQSMKRISPTSTGLAARVFEPDPHNYEKCLDKLDAYKNVDIQIYNLATGSAKDELYFSNEAGSASHLLTKDKDLNEENSVIKVKVDTLDDILDVPAGLIKMDIEGAEMSALKGAENIIKRDKPMLAICVYHKVGDILAILNYINSIVPEYSFRLRHYGLWDVETVLYAFIE